VKTSKQLKDLINNEAKRLNLNPQVLLTRFFMERFLERLSLSKHKDNFVLKGGILISAIVGIDARMTRDMDFTIKNTPLNENSIKNALTEIASIGIEDATEFSLTDLSVIREESERNGFKAKFTVEFDKTRNAIQIDITAGDAITPSEIMYNYRLLLGNRSIDIASYPIETILAEKLESILSRSVANTRMKDFYDCYALSKLYGNSLKRNTVLTALENTAKIRKTEFIFEDVPRNIEMIRTDNSIKSSWLAYSKQFSYANGIGFDEVIHELKILLSKINQ